MSIYSAVLLDLLEYDLRNRKLDDLYVLDRFDAASFVQEESSGTTRDPAATAPFPADLRACLEGTRLTGLPSITLVPSSSDPRIRRRPPRPDAASWEPPPPTIGGAVVHLSLVPPGDTGFVVSAWADFGGGLDAHGGDFVIHRSSAGWQVVRALQATA